MSLFILLLLLCGLLLVYVLNVVLGVDQQNNLIPAAEPPIAQKVVAEPNNIQSTPQPLYLVHTISSALEYANTVKVAEANAVRANTRAGVTLRDIFGIAQYLPANTKWDVDINEGAIPDPKDSKLPKMPALIWASGRGLIEVVEALLVWGANPNVKYAYEYGPQYALIAAKENEDITKKLLKAGADLGVMIRPFNFLVDYASTDFLGRYKFSDATNLNRELIRAIHETFFAKPPLIKCLQENCRNLGNDVFTLIAAYAEPSQTKILDVNKDKRSTFGLELYEKVTLEEHCLDVSATLKKEEDENTVVHELEGLSDLNVQKVSDYIKRISEHRNRSLALHASSYLTSAGVASNLAESDVKNTLDAVVPTRVIKPAGIKLRELRFRIENYLPPDQMNWDVDINGPAIFGSIPALIWAVEFKQIAVARFLLASGANPNVKWQPRHSSPIYTPLSLAKKNALLMKMLIEFGAAFEEIVGRPFQYSEDYPLASFKNPIYKMRFTETDSVNRELMRAIYQKICEEENKRDKKKDSKVMRDTELPKTDLISDFFAMPESVREVFKASFREIVKSLEKQEQRHVIFFGLSKEELQLILNYINHLKQIQAATPSLHTNSNAVHQTISVSHVDDYLIPMRRDNPVGILEGAFSRALGTTAQKPVKLAGVKLKDIPQIKKFLPIETTRWDADINQPAIVSRAALMRATMKEQAEFAWNFDSIPALFWAIDNNAVEVVQVLLKFGADPNLKYANQYSAHTALFLARDNEQITRILIQAGAKLEEIIDKFFIEQRSFVSRTSLLCPCNDQNIIATDFHCYGVNRELIKAIYQKIVEEEKISFNDTVDIKERRDVKSTVDHPRLRFFGFPEYTREIFKANCRRVIQSLERERIRDAFLDVSTDFTRLDVERTSGSLTALPTSQQAMTLAYAAMRKTQSAECPGEDSNLRPVP